MSQIGSPASVSATPPLPAGATRSLFVSVLSWCLIGVSALLSLVSLMSLLMVLAGNHGTSHANLFEGFVVIGVPPLTVIAGVGLLRRKRWAFAYVLALLGSIAVWNAAQMLRGPTPQHTYTSSSGVRTTVLASSVDYPTHLVIIAAAIGVLAKLLSKSVRAEFRLAQPSSDGPSADHGRGAAMRTVPAAPSRAPERAALPRQSELEQRSAQHAPADVNQSRDWRVGHQGRDEMYYEEKRGGEWQRIRISGEMLMGRAHHVIYFAGPQAWLEYPEWARDRRDEIIARIKSVLRAPDYEYHGDVIDQKSLAVSPAAANSTRVSASVPRFVVPRKSRASSFALFVAIAALFGISCGMGWLVWSGITQGQTHLPVKLASHRRSVVRIQEPALYWVSIGIYTIVGAGTFGLGAWGLREASRLRKPARAR